MNVKEIVAEYLAVNGYGGLYGECDCGCFLDDLMPCGEGCDTCEAAYAVPAHCDTCEAGCDSRGEKGVDKCLTTEMPAQDTKEAVANVLTTAKAVTCVKCGSNNIKCRGSIWNCEDCGFTW
jgi:hypothetical protein